jgi:GMP synthase (glutamine-hydrolysing)
MILIISTCKEPLSELEFVEPLTQIVPDSESIHYLDLAAENIAAAEKIIISGTALADFDYLEGDFSWITTFDKPILGICAGAQVIAKAFGWKLIDEVTIGVKPVEVVKQDSLLNNNFNAYFLHTKGIRGDFVTLVKSGETPALVKHPSREIYACIFHPEVLNQELLLQFLRL